jgi:hypothetical protein
VVTQGATLDEVTANLKEAVELHLEDEDASQVGRGQGIRTVIPVNRDAEHGLDTDQS